MYWVSKKYILSHPTVPYRGIGQASSQRLSIRVGEGEWVTEGYVGRERICRSHMCEFNLVCPILPLPQYARTWGTPWPWVASPPGISPTINTSGTDCPNLLDFLYSSVRWRTWKHLRLQPGRGRGQRCQRGWGTEKNTWRGEEDAWTYQVQVLH